MAERSDFGALVEHERFHEAGTHGRFQIKIDDDVREVGFARVLASNLIAQPKASR
jgi:hypothetical protein